jgi:pimeloyl-ACP methyl ester carboxylesterase
MDLMHRKCFVCIYNLNDIMTSTWISGNTESSQDGKTDLLLLHGASFNSETWEKLGTMQLFANDGRRVIAVDLPGGPESKTSGPQATTDTFLPRFMNAVGLKQPVVVAPSMAGGFAFPMLKQEPQRFAGTTFLYIQSKN